MWQEFFSQAYKLPLLVLKRAMANPMGIFVYGILSKWYLIVMIATISVTFWVFKGLEQAGVIDAITKELKYGFQQAQAVSQKCVPLIVNIPAMWDCIQHTSGNDYMPNEDEKALTNTLQHDLENGQGNPFQEEPHPYDDTNPPSNSAMPNQNSGPNVGANSGQNSGNIPTQNPTPATAPDFSTPRPVDSGDGVNRL